MMCSALAMRPALLTVLPIHLVHTTVLTLMMLELDVKLSVSVISASIGDQLFVRYNLCIICVSFGKPLVL